MSPHYSNLSNKGVCTDYNQQRTNGLRLKTIEKDSLIRQYNFSSDEPSLNDKNKEK